ncbi:hypothetical protein IPM65_00660 [Candidatus Roizmanbacteria bacterium]|nr:MAG: hypothetical protein IPM65_00660 [Candidatus Roizmanbacteria bacterium]
MPLNTHQGISADGNLVAYITKDIEGDLYEQAYLWDKRTGNSERISQYFSTRVENVLVTQDGKYAIYVGYEADYVSRFYDISLGKETDPYIGVSASSVSAHGDYFVGFLSSGEHVLYNRVTRTYVPVEEPIGGAPGEPWDLLSVDFNGDYLYYSYIKDRETYSSKYAIYDLETGETQHFLYDNDTGEWVGSKLQVVSQNGKTILFLGQSSAVCEGYYLWNVPEKAYQCVNLQQGEYLALSGDGRYLIGTWEQKDQIYDFETGEETVIRAHIIWDQYYFASEANTILLITTDQIDPDDLDASYDLYLYEFDDSSDPTETSTPTVTPTPTSTPDASPTPTPTPTPEGFDVKEDAWSFENAGYDITWEHFRAAFGDGQTMKANGEPSDRADNEFKGRGFESMADGGLCFGYNLTTSKLYADLPHGFSLPSGFTEYETVHDVPSPGYSFGSLQKGVLGDYLATYFLYSQGTEFLTQYVQNQNLSYAQIESRIKSSIEGDMNDPLLLNIYYVPAFPWPLNFCIAHVVTPFKYTEDVTGMNVFVYDANYPDQEKKLRLSKDGTWGYEGWASTQECRLKTFNPASPEYHTKPILVPISSSTVAGTPTLFPEHGSEVASIMSLTNAWIYPQEGMFLTLPLNGISDSVHRTLVVTDTGRISATVFYTDGISSNIGIASPDSVMSVEAIGPTYGMTDVVAFDPSEASFELTAGSTLTRTISTIVSEGDAEKATRLTCSYPDSSMTSLASDMQKSVIAVSEALEHCHLVVDQDVELAYTLPSLPSGSTVTLAVQPDQSLSVGIDTDGDGSVDTEILVEHEDTTRYLYLPLIER